MSTTTARRIVLFPLAVPFLIWYAIDSWRMGRAADAWRAQKWADIEAGIPGPDGPSMMFEAYWADEPHTRNAAASRAAAMVISEPGGSRPPSV